HCHVMGLTEVYKTAIATIKAEAFVGSTKVGEQVFFVSHDNPNANQGGSGLTNAVPQTKELGGLSNLGGYCRATRGNNYTAQSNSSGWQCVSSSAANQTLQMGAFYPIDMDAACRSQYPNSSAWAKQKDRNNQNSWA